MRNYRESEISEEQKAKNSAFMRNYRASKRSQKEKAKNSAYMTNYRAKQTSNIQSCISKFHEVVSQDPIYICTCCDQLWYKHSVHCANAVRKSNPEIVKYLFNKQSVDNIEWICQFCNYLRKNKVPPCDIMIAMAFPSKPDFFDLNELECRLLAPRIAFQKRMQAPRGKQLKIHGNVVNVPADM